MAKQKRDKNERVLSIRDLNISFKTNFGTVRAIRGVRLDLFQAFFDRVHRVFGQNQHFGVVRAEALRARMEKGEDEDA